MKTILQWRNAWRIRILALGLIVTMVGVGTQVLVNAVAATPDFLTVKVSAYALQGRMADGNWTHPGACAVSTKQFPFGTIIALYNPDGTFNRQCTAEDTGGAITYGRIDLAMPGDYAAAIHWGVRTMSAQVVRWGWGGADPTAQPSPVAPKPVLPGRIPRRHRLPPGIN
ncbi:MAG TPA: 3D domain-containing protein [Ktedonobacteraceae bacterium]|nr:3D domain-containing protein [Ktedonobacteraceae bacterium]